MTKSRDKNDDQGDFSILDDQELLNRCREGQDDAATALYLRYANRLQRLAESKTDKKMAMRVDPEGVVQSVFRTFFRRVNRGQYNVGEGEDLWNLFLVISLNKLRTRATRHRAGKRDVTRTHSLQEHDQSQAQGNNYDEEALTILKLTIEEILGSLPESQSQIVRLRIEGHDVNEIAKRTQRAKRSVERILQNFRKRLRSVIEE